VTKEISTWNFAVVGCDSNDWPQYLGVRELYEEAVELQGSMAAAGWRRVAVFDAALREVKEKPILREQT
jgi:hypothetical protein